MEKLELENKITELEAQIVELKKELQKGTETDPTKYEFWKPDDKGAYYTISQKYGLIGYHWENLGVEKEYQELGLVYKTAGQAEYEANCMKYKHLYRRYIQEHTEPLNWEDVGQRKYNVYWNYGAKCFEIGLDGRCKYAGKEYASSEQIIRDAIQFVGEDNFKKYVLEIEE